MNRNAPSERIGNYEHLISLRGEMNFRNRLSTSLSVTRPGFLPPVEKRIRAREIGRNATGDKLVGKNEYWKCRSRRDKFSMLAIFSRVKKIMVKMPGEENSRELSLSLARSVPDPLHARAHVRAYVVRNLFSVFYNNSAMQAQIATVLAHRGQISRLAGISAHVNTGEITTFIASAAYGLTLQLMSSLT